MLKSLCFFFFVVATVDTTRKLKTLLAVYTATQLWRVLEPLFMHLKSGYWGDITSLGNWEYMDRLSGAPDDIINPNGLAFVVIMTLPMLHFLIKPDTTVRRVLWAVTACAMCYALVLSASRSGFLALVFLCLFVIWRSKNRAAWLTVAVVGALLATALMTGLQRDRYVSIFSHTAPGGVTAQGRINGVMEDFRVSLRHPFFGHGLGTSQEANAHFRDDDKPSHNLYTEVAEELGYVGLALALGLIWSFVRTCWTAQRVVSATSHDGRAPSIPASCCHLAGRRGGGRPVLQLRGIRVVRAVLVLYWRSFGGDREVGDCAFARRRRRPPPATPPGGATRNSRSGTRQADRARHDARICAPARRTHEHARWRARSTRPGTGG